MLGLWVSRDWEEPLTPVLLLTDLTSARDRPRIEELLEEANDDLTFLKPWEDSPLARTSVAQGRVTKFCSCPVRKDCVKKKPDSQ